MTAAQRKTAVTTITLTVVGGFLTWLLTTAASSANAAKLDTSRFVADSSRRDGERDEIRDALRRLETSAIRTESRVSAMYCGQLPDRQRAGCQ